jgi:hypothetical protein
VLGASARELVPQFCAAPRRPHHHSSRRSPRFVSAAALSLACFGEPREERYFTAKELDILAVPFTPMSFDRLGFALDKMSERRLRLRVFINEAGTVDEVRLEGRTGVPAFEDEVRREFMGARFVPAVRHGRVVKSQKLVEIYPTTE